MLRHLINFERNGFRGYFLKEFTKTWKTTSTKEATLPLVYASKRFIMKITESGVDRVYTRVNQAHNNNI